MKADDSTRRERLLAWLTGAGTVLALLVATALFLAFEDLRWGALVLALSTGLAGAFALFQVRSARTSASMREPGAPGSSPIRQETRIGLPVHATTGLYKPWIFRQRLAEEMARDRRYKHSLAVLLLEPANLLEEPTPEGYALAAKALRRAIRAGDFAAQFNEERFVVLLPETHDEGAKVAGRRLLAGLRSSSEQHVRWRGALVTYPEDGTEANTLLDRAEIMLRRGRLESAVRWPSTGQA